MEYVIINIDQLESTDHTSVRKIAAEKQQRLWLLFVQKRTRKHKKSVACVYTDEHGLKKLKCSCHVTVQKNIHEH